MVEMEDVHDSEVVDDTICYGVHLSEALCCIAVGNPNLRDIQGCRVLYDIKRNTRLPDFNRKFSHDTKQEIDTLVIELASEAESPLKGLLDMEPCDFEEVFRITFNCCSNISTVKLSFLGMDPDHDELVSSLIHQLPVSVQTVEILQFEGEYEGNKIRFGRPLHQPRFWEALGSMSCLETLLLPRDTPQDGRPTTVTSIEAFATAIEQSSVRHLRIGGISTFDRAFGSDAFESLFSAVRQKTDLESISIQPGYLRDPHQDSSSARHWGDTEDIVDVLLDALIQAESDETLIYGRYTSWGNTDLIRPMTFDHFVGLPDGLASFIYSVNLRGSMKRHRLGGPDNVIPLTSTGNDMSNLGDWIEALGEQALGEPADDDWQVDEQTKQLAAVGLSSKYFLLSTLLEMQPGILWQA